MSLFTDIESLIIATARRAAPAYREALIRMAEGERSDEVWRRVQDRLGRGMVLAALIGDALVVRKLVRAGVLDEPDNPALRSVPSNGVTFSMVPEVSNLPFLDALNRFRDLVPDLAPTVARLVERSNQRTDAWVARQIADAESILAKATGNVGTLGGVGVRSEAAAAALRSVAGKKGATRLMETEARTQVMDSFNRASQERAAANPRATPILVLDEIRDKRTRGNPTGLYPDAGPHWQMDGFAAAADDPIWQRLTPPNGWNCRASLRSVTVTEAERKGWARRDGEQIIVETEKLRRQFAKQWRIINEGRYPDLGFDS